MLENSLSTQAKAGTARFFLQFGGQGTPWLHELLRYYNNADFDRFFSTVLQAIEEERPRIEDSIGLPHGLDIRSWLENKDTIPSEEYLSYASVSMPLVHATQMAHLENIYLQGISRKQLLEWSSAASGHSQGIITAALACLNCPENEYYEALAKFTKYQLYLGVSAQKAHPYPKASEEEIAASQELGGGVPSPMAAVLGSDHKNHPRVGKYRQC